VIAETTELGTRFAKMSLPNELGRYVIPDLPKAKYRVWVPDMASSIAQGRCDPAKPLT